MKRKTFEIIRLAATIGVIVFSSIMTIALLVGARYVMFNDGELLDDGRFMICQYEIVRTPGLDLNPMGDGILFIEENGTVSRHITNLDIVLDQPHEAIMKDDGNILVANCRNDTIVEIDESNKVVWVFDLRQLDWTIVDPAFTEGNIVNNPFGDDWSHVNDVDLKEINGSEYLLISARNFDMVFEINYTRSREKNLTDAADITRWYGFPGNYSMLRKPHNPDYSSDDAIIVADSENQRVVEVDFNTGEVLWVSPPTQDFFWVRDADICPWDDELLLITDSLNHRVIEYNRATDTIVREYTGMLIQPYQSDYVNETHWVISDGVGGRVIIVNADTGEITREFITQHGSHQYVQLVFTLMVFIPLTFILFTVLERVMFKPSKKNKTRQKKKNIKNLITIIVATGFIVFIVFSMMQPQWLLKSIVLTIHAIVRN